jgi:TonB family protein
MENLWNILVGVFNWVAQASIYAVAVIIIIFLIQVLGRRHLPARWSYALWMILLVRMILPAGPQSVFSLWNLAPQWVTRSGVSSLWQFNGEPEAVSSNTADFILPIEQIGTASPPASDPIQIQMNSDSGKPVPLENASSRAGILQRALKLAPIAWLTGVLSLIIGISVSNLHLWYSVRRERLITDQALLELFEDCRQQLRVRTMVGLVETGRVKSPSLFGFIRPRVLLPKGLPQQVPPEELRYIFLHELAHLKRGDIWIGWIVAFLQSLHWFNPLVWWAFAKMRFDRELACDAVVLGRVHDVENRRYGDTLIGMLERFSHSQHLPAVAGILENGTQLKRRLAMITGFKRPTRFAGIGAVILLVVLSSAMLTEAGSDAGVTVKSSDQVAVEQTLSDMPDSTNRKDSDRREEFNSQTEQDVKYVTRYTIHFSNGLSLETYLPSSLSPATTGGFELQKVFTLLVDPVYPEIARTARLSGEVVFLVTADKDGSVIGAIRRMGNPILAEAAATALRHWKANPMVAGNSSITFPVQFVFHPDGTVDAAQTVPTLGIASIKQSELHPYHEGFPKPEDFLIGEPPDGLAALTEEAMPQFVAPTEIP